MLELDYIWRPSDRNELVGYVYRMKDWIAPAPSAVYTHSKLGGVWHVCSSGNLDAWGDKVIIAIAVAKEAYTEAQSAHNFPFVPYC